MKITNRFVSVCEDSKAMISKIPPIKEGAQERTIARLHYDLLHDRPYHYDMDSFGFEVFCLKNNIDEADRADHFEAFIAKGQPCMRCSPLTKTYGFGAHYNEDGKISIFPMQSDEYAKMLADKNIKIEKAMRNKRA